MYLRSVHVVFVSGLSYLFSIALSRIHLSSVWPSTRWQESNLINQRDAVAPNDADDYEMMKMLVVAIMLIISVMTMMLLAQMSNPIYDQPTRLSEMCTKGKTL